MAGAIKFPEAKDFSLNNPTTILSERDALYLYARADELHPPQTMADNILRSWVKHVAKQLGWPKVEFHGNQVLLSLLVEKPEVPANTGTPIVATSQPAANPTPPIAPTAAMAGTAVKQDRSTSGCVTMPVLSNLPTRRY